MSVMGIEWNSHGLAQPFLTVISSESHRWNRPATAASTDRFCTCDVALAPEMAGKFSQIAK